MLARAGQKKAEAQDRFRAHAEKRQALLTRAIQSQRVIPDFAEVSAEPSASDLRRRFDGEMNRLLRTHLGSQVGEAGDDGSETDA